MYNPKALLSVVLAVTLSVHLVSSTNNGCHKACGHNARCNDDRCQCLDGLLGNPDFACFHPSDYQCQLTSSPEPELTTFGKESNPLRILASMTLANETTAMSKGVQCSLILKSWGNRFGGNYHLGGLDFETRLQWAGHRECRETFRVIAQAVNGHYTWEIIKGRGTYYERRYRVDNLSRRPIWVSIGYYNYISFSRTSSGFLVVNVACCGFEFGIRPFNPNFPNTIPGMWMNAVQPPNSNNLPLTLCNNAQNRPSIENIFATTDFPSKSQMLTFFGFANGRIFDYPHAYSNLRALTQLLLGCDEGQRKKLVVNADFLISDVEFIGCVKDRIWDVMHNIIRGYCSFDTRSCSEAIREIKHTCSYPTSNRLLNDFLRNGCV